MDLFASFLRWDAMFEVWCDLEQGNLLCPCSYGHRKLGAVYELIWLLNSFPSLYHKGYMQSDKRSVHYSELHLWEWWSFFKKKCCQNRSNSHAIINIYNNCWGILPRKHSFSEDVTERQIIAERHTFEIQLWEVALKSLKIAQYC